MCKCGNARCTGYYLLHPKECTKEVLNRIKTKERLENPNCKFILIDSPSSGEMYITFKELHVLAG